MSEGVARGDKRRSALLESLDHHLRESSLESINIADISRRAGVTRSAFYFYFENKAAAVAALMERMVDDTFFVNDVFTTDPRDGDYHEKHQKQASNSTM